MKKELSYYEIIEQVSEVAKCFEKNIEKELDIVKVPCPLFVKKSSGLQDDLSGKEKAIGFIKDEEDFEVVHSLAKWKRDALYRYNFPMHKGIYTDMNAIRKDEVVDDIHSLLVQQWDWEKVISKEDRNIDYLKDTVRKIYKAIYDTNKYIDKKYKDLKLDLPKEISFVTSQELEDMYGNLSPKEREYEYVKETRAAFIIGIGDTLKSGNKHDDRSPDYDDWSLNGDLFVFDDILNKPVELSSMGIRVDDVALKDQLEKASAMFKISMPYHKKVMENTYPYTIGGGIGMSRLLLVLLNKKHVAEVQASSWTIGVLENQLKDSKIL